MNNVDDNVLLCRGHLVVTGEAEAPAEDVGADVDACAFDIGVGFASSISFNGDKGVGSIDGLHVHRLPDGAAFRIEGGKGSEDLSRAGLAGFMLPELVLFAADKGAHGVFIQDHAAQPEVGLGVLCIIGVHVYRQILQAFFVAFIDCPLLGDMLVQVRDLAADDTGDDVAHAVVVADLLMLVPGGGFAALGAPFADLVGVLQTVGQEHAAGGAGDDLVAVKADAVVVAEAAGLNALIGGTKAFGCVLDDEGVVLVADCFEFIHFARRAVEMRNDNEADVGIQRKGFLQGFRTHVPGVVLSVDEDGLAVLVGDGVDGGVKGHVGAEDLMALQGAVVGSRLAIETLTGQLCCKVQRCGAGREAHGVLDANPLCQLLFYFIDVFANGTHPVGVDGIIHPFLFITMHGWRRQPYFFLKRLDSRKSQVLCKIHYLFALFRIT